MVVVYEVEAESVGPVLDVLQGEGFNAFALEEPDSEALFVVNGPRYLRWARPKAHIAVPREEVSGAKLILKKWEHSREAEVEKLTKHFWGQMFWSFLIAAAVTVGLFLLGVCSDSVILLFFGVWFVTLLVRANIRGRRAK